MLGPKEEIKKGGTEANENHPACWSKGRRFRPQKKVTPVKKVKGGEKVTHKKRKRIKSSPPKEKELQTTGPHARKESPVNLLGNLSLGHEKKKKSRRNPIKKN